MKTASRQRLVVGLTGGIGCGKSTAGKCLERLGWERSDSDEVIHREVFSLPSVLQAAVELFGEEAVRDGVLQRRRVADCVFSSPELLAEWENRVHPWLFRHWERLFAVPTRVPLVVEVPILFEKGLEKGFDFIACVVTSSQLQLARLEERGLSRALAEQRISRQWPLIRKMDLSHYVLSNDGSTSFLAAQVNHLDQVLVERR